jgi:hypothetical protein
VRLLAELSVILNGISALAQVWEKVHPFFKHAFGF